MRHITIDDQIWQYSIGTSGVGIQEPNKGKRHNIGMGDFTLAVIGSYCILEGNDLAIGPGDIRAYIDRAIRRTQPFSTFTIAHVYDAHNITVLSSLPITEVERLVQERQPKMFLRGEGDHKYHTHANMRPWHLSDKHFFYDFTERE